jgi:hypothetical protein
MNINKGMNIPPLKERIKKSTITLKEYINLLHDEGAFVIPDYQRGYVWGQKKKSETVDSVTFLIKTLKDAYSVKKEVFLQGITVHGDINSYDIHLVDGQQRTTFFYLLLRFLKYDGNLRIKYQIRTQSNDYLKIIDLDSIARKEDEEFQDIFFFKRTLRIFEKELDGYDKNDLLSFLLDFVKFLFVIIPEVQAKIVLTMMNGNKVKMTEEELIKAELLRCASREDKRILEAEHSEMRSRLAREWDYWLHWWNDEEIVKYFRTDGKQLGWLLPLISNNYRVSFKDFRDKMLNEQSIKQSKEVFKRMRLLQKSIEDVYFNSKLYNYLGVILYIRNSSEQRFAFLKWFFALSNQYEETHTKTEEELKRYYDWAIIGVNHEDIVSFNIEKYNDARRVFLTALESNLLFLQNYEVAYRWLLRQNIKQDNQDQKRKGRKFNFNIERDRSLEHIYPKSKIGHRNDENKTLGWDDKELDEKHIDEIKLWREDMKWMCPDDKHVYQGSEHCIGNLVLLYKRDNSKFNDADFRQKNHYFFRDLDDEAFESRHLIHTTMIFSDVSWEDESTGSAWNKEQVPHRKYEELKCFNEEYPELNVFSNE